MDKKRKRRKLERLAKHGQIVAEVAVPVVMTVGGLELRAVRIVTGRVRKLELPDR